MITPLDPKTAKLMATTQVFVGRWTDLSHGTVLGDSFTVPVGTGSFIINGIATFITFVAGFAWAIAAYAAHRFLSRSEEDDIFHNQTRCSFRNSDSPLSTAWEMFRIGMVWSPRKLFYFKTKEGRESMVWSRRRW